MANPSDNRVTIRNKATGALSHGIKGHTPEGYEEYDERALYHAKLAGNAVEDSRLVAPGSERSAEHGTKHGLQVVRNRESNDRSSAARGNVRDIRTVRQVDSEPPDRAS